MYQSIMENKYIYFILVALCFLVYANSLHNAFVSDDIPAILKNPFISSPLRSWADPAAFLNSLNYLIAKFNPFAYHLTNIILHSLNTILVFLFLHLFFKTEASFLGACLFAVHPIHTEAVTWVSGKPYITTSLFILSAYLLYNDATKGKRAGRIKLLISFFIFSYYLIVNISFYFIFPFFLVFSDITFNRWRKNWKYWLPFLGVVILRLILATSQILQRASFVAGQMGQEVTRSNPIFNLAYSFFSHLGLLLWPVWPVKFTLYHEPAVISSFALKAELFCLLLLVLSLPLIYKKAKELFFAIGIFVLFLTPTYSPVMVSWLVAERYLYFPSISLSIFLAFFYEKYLKPMRGITAKNIALGFLIFIIAGYAVRTVARNEDWKSPQEFWRQTVLVSDKSERAHNNMGDAYSQEGNTEGAIREFKKAIELKTNYADAYHNLATVDYNKGDLDEAIKFYQQAIKFNPKLFESQYNLGIIYLNTGAIDLAIKQLHTAKEIRPEDVNARTALNMAINKKK